MKNLRKVLEVGPSRNPLGIKEWYPKDAETALEVLRAPLSIFAQKILPSDVEYHGLEFPSRFTNVEFGQGKRWLETFARSSKSIILEYDNLDPSLKENFIIREMDASKTDYPNGYFHEIHMHYVLSDPSVTLEERFALLKEAKRILDSRGRVILTGEKFRADHTIRVVDSLIKRTEEELTEAGLVIDRQTSLSVATVFANAISKLSEIRREWSDLRAMICEDSYILIASKED